MIRILLVLFTLLAAHAAQAQGLSATTTAATTISPQPMDCQPPKFLGWSNAISNWTCNAPAAGTSVTLTSASPCLTVTGGPAYVIGTNSATVTITAGRNALPSDQCQTIEYNGTSPGTYTLGAWGTAPYTNGWVVCFGVKNAPLTLASAGGTLYGGVVTLAKGDSECVKADDQGGWVLFAGTSRVVPNPNGFQ